MGLKILFRTYVWPDLNHIEQLYRQVKIIYLKAWYSFLSVIFIFVFQNWQNSFSSGPPFIHSGLQNTLNFGSVSCVIRILSRLIQETCTLRKVKNQVLLFLLSWEPNLPDFIVYFCLFQNAILHRVEARFWNFKPIFLRMQFSLVAIFFLYFWLSVWVEIYILNYLMGF